MGSRYIIHKSAGWYWLIDSSQPGMPYKAPIRMNEIGARIWELAEAGKEKAEMIDILQKEYRAPKELLEKDVEQFLLLLSNLE